MSSEDLNLALLIVQFLAFIALGLYVWKTWEMANATKRAAEATRTATEISAKVLQEMQETRDQEVAPYVVVYFDIPHGEVLIDLVVKNVGRGLAENVKLAFQPSLCTTLKSQISDTPLIKTGIPTLPPGYEIRTLFDSTISYLGSGLPKTYEVQVSYSGGLLPTARTSKQVLDLTSFEGLLSVQRKDMDDLVRELEKLVSQGQKIDEHLGKIDHTLSSGLWLKNSDINIMNLPTPAGVWLERLEAKLLELKLIWTIAYGQRREDLRPREVAEFKRRSKYLGLQILLTLSHLDTEKIAALTAPVSMLMNILSEFQDAAIYQYIGRVDDDVAQLMQFEAKIVARIDQILVQIRNIADAVTDSW